MGPVNLSSSRATTKWIHLVNSLPALPCTDQLTPNVLVQMFGSINLKTVDGMRVGFNFGLNNSFLAKLITRRKIAAA